MDKMTKSEAQKWKQEALENYRALPEENKLLIQLAIDAEFDPHSEVTMTIPKKGDRPTFEDLAEYCYQEILKKDI